MDSASSDRFIHPKLVDKLSLKVLTTNSCVHMASTSLSTSIIGICFVEITVHDSNYSNVRLHVMDNLGSDTILGIDFQSQHQSAEKNT